MKRFIPLIAIAVVVIGGFAFYFLRKRSKPNPVNTTRNVPNKGGDAVAEARNIREGESKEIKKDFATGMGDKKSMVDTEKGRDYEKGEQRASGKIGSTFSNLDLSLLAFNNKAN